MRNAPTNMDDVIDSRDIIERIEELEGQQVPRYVAGWNMPGYMPDSEPVEFDDADDALEYLKDEAKETIDQFADGIDGDDAMDKLAGLDAQEREVDAWQTDKLGEFGRTFGKFHYWISYEGKTGLDEDETAELAALIALRDGASDYSPDWSYGETLTRESYFTDYCRELVSDIGDLPKDVPSYIEIDWEATARIILRDIACR